METRAGYFMVGTFVIVTFLAILGFFLWLAREDIEYNVNYYEIYFQGSVTGLTAGANVSFSGVPVGNVKEVGLVPEYQDRVRVLVTIRQDIPVHEDAVASLEMQGVTGYTFVQVRGGSSDAPLLEAKSGQKYPVIASKHSNVEELLTNLPKIANQMTNLLDRVSLLMDEENRRSINKIIENVESLTGKLDKMAGPLDRLLTTADTTLQHLDRDVTGMRDDSKKLFQSLQNVAHTFDTVLQQSQGGLQAFGQNGLYELTQTLAQTKIAALQLSTLLGQLNEGPSQFLFEDKQGGVQIPER